MPAIYTFHRFGTDALRMLPGSLKQPIQRFRRLYNGGLQGADLFFYHNPMTSGSAGSLYSSLDGLTGEAFFTQAARHLKASPSEGGTACLYGLLAHYCLRSQLAPLFRQAIREHDVCRVELEVELERYLLCLDEKTPAHRQDAGTCLKMTRGESVTLTSFFPGATPRQGWKALRRATRWCRRMAAKKRGFTAFLLKLTKGNFRHQMMPDHANHKCLHLDKAMLECYDRALEMYPEMAQRLTLFLKNGTPLGEDFQNPFA